MKKILIFLLVGFIIPQVTFAAWWNPFTWSIFRLRTEVVNNKQAVDGAAATSSSEITLEVLGKKIEELEKQLKESKQSDSEIKKEVVSVAKPEMIKPVTTSHPQTGDLSEKEIIAKVKPAIVFISSSGGSGSGSIIDSSGYVLTNAHVVVGHEDLFVTLAGGIEKSARLIGVDEGHDLAVLKISSAGIFPYIKINYSSGIEQGDKAYVFGYPLGIAGDSGMVSFIDGVISRVFSDYVETTTEFKPGNSGGALVNNRAELVGIPAQALCEIKKGVSNCLKFAINISNVKDIVPKLLDGMMLYKNKQSSSFETAIKSELVRVYKNTDESLSLEKAINDSRESNLFDYYNKQLLGNPDQSLTTNYLNKLLTASSNMVSAFSFLAKQSESLEAFFEDNRLQIANLGTYQKKILTIVEEKNEIRLKDFSSKIGYWSSKKNEYDSLINKKTSVSKDYLLQQDSLLKDTVEYLVSQKKQIIESFSGETVDIF